MDYFTFTTPSGETIRQPFPVALPLEERAAYMDAAMAAHSERRASEPADTPTED